MSIITDTFSLHDGHRIPKLGFGTWQIPDGDICKSATLAALKSGYRHIDTARVYGNEASVGEAIRQSGIPRNEIYLTTKLPAEVKNYEEALKTFELSMTALGEGIDSVDLYLIHAPWAWSRRGESDHEGNLEVWRAMTELQASGRIKSIGVSNFDVEDLRNIIDNSSVKPTVNQIRWFIGATQDEVTDFSKENDILIEAYSPFATGRILENSEILEIAAKYNRSLPQICLRYALQKDVLPLPKSTHAEYIEQNADLDFVIEDSDMDYLDKLDLKDV